MTNSLLLPCTFILDTENEAEAHRLLDEVLSPVGLKRSNSHWQLYPKLGRHSRLITTLAAPAPTSDADVPSAFKALCALFVAPAHTNTISLTTEQEEDGAWSCEAIFDARTTPLLIPGLLWAHLGLETRGVIQADLRQAQDRP